MRLHIAREALEITQMDTHLRTVLARFGFPEEEIAEGLARQKAANRLFSSKDLAFGNQKIATEHLQELARTVSNQLRDDRSIARVVFRGNDGILHLLRVDMRLARSYGELKSQAMHFYREILNDPSLLSALSPYAMTREALSVRVTRVEELAQAITRRQIHKGETRLTTARLRSAMDDLDAWMSQFIGAARLAFRRQPQHLVKLGIYKAPRRKKSEEEQSESPKSDQRTIQDAAE